LAKADCQRLIAESLPKCFGCGYAALCSRLPRTSSGLNQRRHSSPGSRQGEKWGRGGDWQFFQSWHASM